MIFVVIMCVSNRLNELVQEKTWKNLCVCVKFHNRNHIYFIFIYLWQNKAIPNAKQKKRWKNMPKKSLFTIKYLSFFIQNKKKGSYPFAKIKLIMSKWCQNHYYYYKHTRPSKINWTQVHLNTISFWSSIWFFWFCWETTKKKRPRPRQRFEICPKAIDTSCFDHHHHHFLHYFHFNRHHLWSSSSFFFFDLKWASNS